MYYYVDNHKIYIDENKKPYGLGSEGKCYKEKHQIYKIYHPHILDENYETFHQKLLGINTKQIILPNALIYDTNQNYVGYRTIIVNGEQNILKKHGLTTLPKEKLISNLKILTHDMKLLSNNYVLTSDVGPVNYFFDKTNDKMYIIDPGRYRVFRNTSRNIRKYCQKNNNMNLDNLISKLLYNDFLKYKPIDNKEKCIALRDYIMYDKEDKSYYHYFDSVLNPNETINDYAKKIKKHLK